MSSPLPVLPSRSLAVLTVLLVSFSLVTSGCLRTEIVTGKQPTGQTAELPWAHGFINGLVPPVNAPLETQDACGEAGVARVTFQQTFLQLVADGLTDVVFVASLFTPTATTSPGSGSTTDGGTTVSVSAGFSIYTPQRFEATCAARPSSAGVSDRVPAYLLRSSDFDAVPASPSDPDR
jgi:hypothetical protein